MDRESDVLSGEMVAFEVGKSGEDEEREARLVDSEDGM
jgi:hypothetical protein